MFNCSMSCLFVFLRSGWGGGEFLNFCLVFGRSPQISENFIKPNDFEYLNHNKRLTKTTLEKKS